MPREINDNGTNWSLAQAYSGLEENSEEMSEAAKVKGSEDLVYVVATPSGGAQTVRLELKGDWEENLSDEELLDEIKSKQK